MPRYLHETRSGQDREETVGYFVYRYGREEDIIMGDEVCIDRVGCFLNVSW